MRVLVACEFSGIVREAFRARGHDAVSPVPKPGRSREIGGWDYEGDQFMDSMQPQAPAGFHWEEIDGDMTLVPDDDPNASNDSKWTDNAQGWHPGGLSRFSNPAPDGVLAGRVIREPITPARPAANLGGNEHGNEIRS
jgi:hypothetical protein